jgi:arylsulfatase A-like enzyme
MTIQFPKKIALLLISTVISLNAISDRNNSKTLPNIIIILADDLDYGDVSCYNENSKIITPHLDKLASAGIRFSDAHTSSAVCTPTRYGIMTGRYNWRSRLKSGVLSGYSDALIDDDRLTAGKLLQNRNYHTAFIGKWHLGWDWQLKTPYKNDKDKLSAGPDNPDVDFSKPVKNGPQERGFDYSYGFSGSLDMPPYVYVENGMATSIPVDTTQCIDENGFWRKGITGPDFRHAEVPPHLTEKSIQYIDSQANSAEPFFLYFALPAPHTPILPITEFIGKSNTNFYGDFVLQVDDVVGKIISALKKHGIQNNTILLFISDNGCSPKADFQELKRVGHNPSYIFRGSKADIYEGGHRVPFIVSWPDKITKGLVSDEVICTTDILATLAEITGYKLPGNAGEDSYSFLPVIIGKNYKTPLREATVHHSIDGRFAIRQDKWKLILWPGSGGWSYPKTEKELENLPRLQLYDLEADPSESNNIADKYPQKVDQLKELLTEYILQGRSTPGKPRQNENMDNWNQIDWITFEK